MDNGVLKVYDGIGPLLWTRAWYKRKSWRTELSVNDGVWCLSIFCPEG